MVTSELEEKARRRVKRFIKTGEHQARVHQVGKRTYEYKVKHYVESLFFRRTFFKGVRQVTRNELF